MCVSVLSVILGQALFFAKIGLLYYAATLWIVADAFVRFNEEPTLRRRFGRDYDIYSSNVPRWIPRPSPWNR
jgi:protein-S-isoprenylcysteine O-methyltransferase Ste14